MIQFKKKCNMCRKNYVLATNRSGYVVCADCQKREMQGEIKDPEMKKLFTIPDDFYEQSSFLRDIKIKYLKFGSLSERQIEAFRNTVEKLKNPPEEKKAK